MIHEMHLEEFKNEYSKKKKVLAPFYIRYSLLPGVPVKGLSFFRHFIFLKEQNFKLFTWKSFTSSCLFNCNS